MLPTRFTLALLCGLAAAPALAAEVPPTPSAATAVEVLHAVMAKIRAEYVNPPSDEVLMQAAVKGMLSALDPHSRYMTKDAFAAHREKTRGETGGIGAEITVEDGTVRVAAAPDGSPAARAGLASGDRITHIDGRPVAGIARRKLEARLSGRIGTTVRLTVERAGGAAPFEITLTRDPVTVPSVTHRQVGPVGVIAIRRFDQRTYAGLVEAITAFESSGTPRPTGYVLDLRDNPGGLVRQAVAVSDAFLDAGVIVTTRGRGEGRSRHYEAKPGDIGRGRPIVVLVNGGSASASEIVAGALQDHRRAVVMGTQTFGKGSVQSVVPLNDGGALKLTTSRYYTPAGRSIQAVGIAPDIEAPAMKTEGGGADLQLGRAIELIRGLSLTTAQR